MPYDGAVNSNIRRGLWRRRIHKDIARVHIGVEKAVIKYLREKDFNAAFSENLHIDVGLVESGNVANGDAGNSFRDHESGCAVVPEDGGYKYEFASSGIFLQQRRIGGLSA